MRRLLGHGPAAALALALLCAAPGCGYRMQRASEGLAGAHTVAIDGFVNSTHEPGVDSIVSDAFLREFTRRGQLRVVASRERADLVVSGRVQQVSLRPRSFSSVQFALEYDVWLRLAVDVRRQDGSPVRIASDNLAESERYLASADVEVGRTNKEQALRRLATLLAGRVYDALGAAPPP